MTLSTALWVVPLVFIGLICKWVYRLYCHPLSKIPGPKIAACTSLWLAYHTYIGNECTAVYSLHRRYGPVLRVGPNDVDISNADAIEPVYVARGGFPKSDVYSKFDIDGHNTIFSTLTLPERATRAKAVASLFSTASLRQAEPLLSQVFDDFIARLRLEAKKGEPVNVLNICRCMAIDAISVYLFQHRYGALDEDSGVMSASPFVDAYVGVGAFFNLAPGRIGDLIMAISERMTSTDMTKKAFDLIDRFTGQLVAVATPKSGSYQSRLLEKQTSLQSQIEVKDLCFAGTDSTSMNTATIMWYLSKCPKIYRRLREEIQSTVAKGADPMTCSYLRGTIREGLRLSWANPIRLPRAVPVGGWTYHDYHLPKGTSVGVASFQLHQDEKIFPNPLCFMPDRWLDPTQDMLDHFFAFGKGSRACIAQNLGTLEVTMAIFRIVKADLLCDAKVFDESIQIKQWFNSRVRGEEILIQFRPELADN
ncbi:uncharacterized protein N7503_009350 [Penicillium pulvis]|uniref:uncharacterized protein n=1 Tax=Penicillium pulvis TaxID=1562058 RepID=UPI0025493EC4|nr:uncharacterized protein N7503_009350 [Penicillium pulvis]KAJ5793372.1 hypothetical protein N7503_009350 [Penicillium pulvis]